MKASFVNVFSAQTDNTQFSFVSDGTDLDSALQRVMTATTYDSGSSLKHHIIAVMNSRVSVIGFTSNVFVEVLLSTATQVTGSGYVSVTGTVLQGLIKNRKELVFSYDASSNKGLIKFKSVKGVYNGDLTVIPLEDYFLPSLNDKISSFTLNSIIRKDLFDAIIEGVKITSIKYIYFNSQPVLTFVVYSQKTNTLRVYSYDGWHMAVYRTVFSPLSDESGEESKSSSFSLSFKSTMFDMIQKVIGSADLVIHEESENVKKKAKVKTSGNLMDMMKNEVVYRFGVINNSISLSGGDFRILAPYTQSKKIEFESPSILLKKMKEEQESASFEFNNKLLDSASNLYSLMTVKGLQYNLTAKKDKGVYLSIKTNNGDATDKITVKNLVVNADSSVTINFDPEVFKDITRCLSKVDLENASPVFSFYSSCYKISCNSQQVNADDAGDEDTRKKTKKPTKNHPFSLTVVGSVYSAE